MQLVRTFHFINRTTGNRITATIEHRPALKQVEIEVTDGKRIARDKRKFDTLNESAETYVRLITKPTLASPPGFDVVSA